MFLRNYLADDEKSKEILPEHTTAAIAVLSEQRSKNSEESQACGNGTGLGLES